MWKCVLELNYQTPPQFLQKNYWKAYIQSYFIMQPLLGTLVFEFSKLEFQKGLHNKMTLESEFSVFAKTENLAKSVVNLI